MLVEIVLRHSWVLCGGWETWEDAEPPWRMKTRSNWTALPMSSFCHRSERENFLENKKCFFFPLNLLQKLRAKASREIWTKYICFQSLWEAYWAVSCASDKLGFHQLGRCVCSLCLAFSLLWLQFLKGSFLNSSMSCPPSSSYLVGTSKCSASFQSQLLMSLPFTCYYQNHTCLAFILTF